MTFDQLDGAKCPRRNKPRFRQFRLGHMAMDIWKNHKSEADFVVVIGIFNHCQSDC